MIIQFSKTCICKTLWLFFCLFCFYVGYLQVILLICSSPRAPGKVQRCPGWTPFFASNFDIDFGMVFSWFWAPFWMIFLMIFHVFSTPIFASFCGCSFYSFSHFSDFLIFGRTLADTCFTRGFIWFTHISLFRKIRFL